MQTLLCIEIRVIHVPYIILQSMLIILVVTFIDIENISITELVGKYKNPLC